MSFSELWVHPLGGGAIFLVGLCWGSFLNVCIYRWPLGRSVVWPGSRCAACGIALKPQCNVPVLSWLWLKGWCGCGLVRLSWHYPLVEVLTGLLFWGLWWNYSPVLFLIYSVFVSGLVVASGIDRDYFVIPDALSLGGIAAGLALSALWPSLHEAATWWEGIKASGLGMLTGLGLLGGVFFLCRWVLRKEGMGLGDVFLLGAMGAFLGWPACLFTVAISSLLGSLMGLACLLLGQKTWMGRLPYGPYLAAAAILWLLGGKTWFSLYWGWLQG
jgi:leader peptidase (prepilin peptidase) / N-methyltransferase